MSWLLLIAVLLLALVLNTTPRVGREQTGSQNYLAATRNLLDHRVRANPSHPQKQRSIALTAADLTAVANYVLLKKQLDGVAVASIHGKRLDIKASIKLVSRPTDLYLNLKLVADDAQPQLLIRQLKLGRIALPTPLISMLQFVLLHWTPLQRYAQIITPLIHEIRIVEQSLKVTINWDRKALTPAQPLDLTVASRDRLFAYQQKLQELLDQYPEKRYINIGLIVQPMFALALERSALPGNDAVDENRALILVLAAYANGRNVLQELGDEGTSAALPQKSLLLNRRIDTAQHFMGSATLATSGHRTFADVIGMAKEINDTHSGSGFSFTDLAADRAGALFGKIVTKSPEHAREAQIILSQSSDESVFMPSIRDLPENLGPEDFAQRFGTIDSAEFEALKRNIEERIQSCILYR